MNYQIVVPKSVQKQLDALPENAYSRVIEKLMTLRENPRPRGCVKLKGYRSEYRIRVGDYRVRYEIRDKELVVLLLHCEHRRDIYRDR